MVRAGDPERLRKLAGAGTERVTAFGPAARFHFANAAGRFERADQNDPVFRTAFHQNIEQPVDAVIQIDIRRAGKMPLNKGARGRTREGVARFIVEDTVSFGLNDEAGAIIPDELTANERARAFERMHLEEFAWKRGSGGRYVPRFHKPVG